MSVIIFLLLSLFSVKCGDVDNIIHGHSSSSTNGSTSQVDFTCGTGFTLNGDSQITCNENGVWSNNVPTCGN
jgi:hypothetical protein